MSEPQTTWRDEYGDYISGAFFGLVTLDIFMLLIHCMTEQTIEGYSLSTLAISFPLVLAWSFERLYAQHSDH
jgi:hypothetical protein